MTSQTNLRLIWTNPKKQLDLYDFWIDSMNEYLKYMNKFLGLWTAPHIIPRGKWIKKICLEDGERVVYLVLDYDGIELASVPVNFSVAISSHSDARNLDRIIHI